MLFFDYLIVSLLIFLLGSCIGSFLNVVIYRLPLGLNVAAGRSFCPRCHETIKPYDLIPVISYLILGGKCRHCGMKIALRYPMVELICGLAALYLFWQYDMGLYAVCLFGLFTLLLAVALIDLDTMTIPDGLHIALLVVAVVTYFVQPELPLVDRAIGFLAVSLPMYLLCLALDGGLGGGDIKLMAVCGLILGWKNILLAMFFAAVFGGAVAVYLIVTRKMERKDHMPFGPFLSVGIMAAALWGDGLLSWYFGLF